MSPTTTQNLARIKQLARDGNASFFERLKLAAQVLMDHEWIVDNFNGCDADAMDYVQQEGFSMIAGVYTLGDLLKMYHAFPQESDWQAVKYDLKAMHLRLKGVTEDEEPEQKPRTDWRAKCAELMAEVQRLKLDNAELRVKIAELRHPVAA